ncbi:hypothetical protein AVEN_117564-1 [Araneus ventricosus]|uniref:Uncharacterized protein n=1 Tax=Araneus ventricosus TaxID=182803 RepID=A0A4Y2IVX9_ARAVE|nr:hypothetical protein AVEN_117564-1 [Araneus ventricosus]
MENDALFSNIPKNTKQDNGERRFILEYSRKHEAQEFLEKQALAQCFPEETARWKPFPEYHFPGFPIVPCSTKTNKVLPLGAAESLILFPSMRSFSPGVAYL